MQSWRFAVEQSQSGQRLDAMISAMTGLSRRRVREMLKLGGVQVNRRRVRTAGRMPQIGSEIRATLDKSLGAEPNFIPETLYEDDWVLVLYKPSGIPVQGTLASDRHDFMAVVRRHFANQELFLTHRLDTGTSGTLLLAKGARAAGDIGKAFQGRAVQKTYLAAVQSNMGPCTLDAPIGRTGERPTRYGCTGGSAGGKRAVTSFFPKDMPEMGLADAHWLIAVPLTGRTHQIRVHLAHLGNPVIGDSLYGGRQSSRLWLHAWKLVLPHPALQRRIEVQTDIRPVNDLYQATMN